MKPFVSVVIDNYNYGRFLGAAIESVLAQEYPPDRLEIVVVDDGSTDDSRQVLARYEGRVRAVFQENQGYGQAFNRGIGESKGSIVCLLDADDVWMKDKVPSVVERFEREPDLGAVQHLLQDAGPALEPWTPRFPEWPERYRLDDYLEGRVVPGATSGLSFRRKTLDAALPIPKELRFLYADDFLLVSALFQGPVGNIGRPLGLHRVHGGNFCAGTFADRRKLAADFEMGAVFRKRRAEWLAAAGKELGIRHAELEALEDLRRQILWNVYEGRRSTAAAIWLKALWGPSAAFGLFRALTCGLALISPALYLSAYDSYSKAEGLKALRRKWIPS